MSKRETDAMEELLSVVQTIREKCPWDSVQTMESLKERVISETEEVLRAVDTVEQDKGENLCEELGDVLMLLMLYSRIAAEQGLFTWEDVMTDNAWKMKFRHPNIFPTDDPALKDLGWEELKARERELRVQMRRKNRLCDQQMP